jgi:ElaB/YqjD/DUF883 family membrane-anchored ribosome-binding protein
MTDAGSSEEKMMELESEVETLKETIAEHEEKAEAKRMVDFVKLKDAINSSAKEVLDAIKPVIEKYEEPGRAAVSKVERRVADNPFLSVVIAFGAGIVIGKLLDYHCCRKEEE